MTIRLPALILLASLGLSLTAPAALAAPGFAAVLTGRNFMAFGEADMKLFINMAETTVGSQPDGVPVHFNGQQAGVSATMSVAKSYTRDGYSCRALAGETTVNATTEPFTLHYCRDKAGAWRLASSSSP
jgi:hypothetical protein